MVRFPNRRDHSMTPGPPVPEKGAAGKDEKRNEKIRAKQGQTYTNRHQRKIDNPFTETVDGVLGISKDRVEEYKPVYEFDAAGLTSSGDVRNPSKRVSEHLLTGGARWDTRKQPGAPEGGADGDENRSQVAGLLSFEAPDAPATFANLAGPDAAGKRTVELSSHNGVPIAMMADEHVAQKVGGRVPRKGPTGARRNVSTVDEIVYGRDTDDSGSADTRDFHGAAGSRTEPPEGPSCFWHRPTTAKYTGLESTADAVIFGRDLDQSSKNPDPRDFSGAAGNPSSSADHAGIFNEAESERVRFEDIPHSMFSAPGRKMVRSQGTTADNVIQYKPDDPSETNFVSEMKEYHGAAGESSKKASDRAVSEMMSNKKKTKGGDSEIDALVFNRDLDNSDAYEAAEDELYKGAFGTRSKCNFNPHDMSQRVMWKDGKVITGERMNDGMLYGNNVVQGTDIDGDTKNDTRDFEGAAGNSTQYLAERELCLVDITKRQASVGSSLVNPSSADELIFGRNVDASGDDPRDFVDSAGEGAYMNRRNPYDVTNTYKRRPASGWLGRGADDSTVDELLYGGRDLGADRSMACTDASRPLAVTEEGTAAGKQTQEMWNFHEKQMLAAHKRRVAVDPAFDLINGEHSTKVADLVVSNPAYDGVAGVTSHTLNTRLVSDHKRSEAVDMVADPNVAPGVAPMKGAKNAEYAKLYGSSVGDVVFPGSGLSGPQQGDTDAVFEGKGVAGLTSNKLVTIRNGGDRPAGTRSDVKDYTDPVLLEDAAGRIGSVSKYEAKSKKKMLPHSTNANSTVRATIEFQGAKDPKAGMLQTGGSVQARAGFRHHSQSNRVGLVVFGQQQPDTLDAQGNMRGTVSYNPAMEEHFNTSAGKTSEAAHAGDLAHKLDVAPTRVRPISGGSTIDQVVFGHDLDQSTNAGLHRTGSGVALAIGGRDGSAGKGSDAIHTSKDWVRRKAGLVVAGQDIAGGLDKSVFNRDVDLSDTPEQKAQLEREKAAYVGAAGSQSGHISMNMILNDSAARMHMPIEYHKKGDLGGMEGSIDTLIFNHDMDGSAASGNDDDGVVGKAGDLYKGAAGATSGALNDHKQALQHKTHSHVYDLQRSEVDTVVFGHDIDGSDDRYTLERILEVQQGSAGRASLTRVVEEASESRAPVPHRHGTAAMVLYPDVHTVDEAYRRPHELRQRPAGVQGGVLRRLGSQKVMVEGNSAYEAHVARDGRVGGTSEALAGIAYREVDRKQGVTRPKGRAAPKELVGSAGKRGKEQDPHKVRPRSAPVDRGSGRNAGKASGGRHDGSGVAMAMAQGAVTPSPRSPPKQRAKGKGGKGGPSTALAVAPPPAEAPTDAYAAALAEGRDLVQTPYAARAVAPILARGVSVGSMPTPDQLAAAPPRHPQVAGSVAEPGAPVVPNETAFSYAGDYVAPKYGEGDMAGNYRKRAQEKVTSAHITETRMKTTDDARGYKKTSPFGVDSATPRSVASRFQTSSSAVGARARAGMVRDQYGQEMRMAPTATAARAPPASTALVPAAGQRPASAKPSR